MAVHTHRATYDQSRPFTAWIHAIARYKLIDHARQNRIRQTVPIDDVEFLFATDDFGSGNGQDRCRPAA